MVNLRDFPETMVHLFGLVSYNDYCWELSHTKAPKSPMAHRKIRGGVWFSKIEGKQITPNDNSQCFRCFLWRCFWKILWWSNSRPISPTNSQPLIPKTARNPTQRDPPTSNGPMVPAGERPETGARGGLLQRHCDVGRPEGLPGGARGSRQRAAHEGLTLGLLGAGGWGWWLRRWWVGRSGEWDPDRS